MTDARFGSPVKYHNPCNIDMHYQDKFFQVMLEFEVQY